ncbi:MAG TPA: glutamate carboxypeptidase [Rhizomicrobium sp.]|jgi:glutamate carboxypeptidase|nr:glutamate carboxypeptidase [Rhizomicrobium sp.]
MRKTALAALYAALLVTPAFAASRNDAIYAAVQANRAGFLDLLGQIVNIDSGTGDVAGGAKITALLAGRLKALGADTHYEAAEAPGLPDNLVAIFHGAGKGRILIIAHADTVFGPGTVAGRPFRMDGTKAHGPGVGDEKAGLVSAVTALKILHDTGFKNFATITLLVETSEERGSIGTTKLIRALSARHDVEFNMEPGDPPDALTVWRKGSSVVHIHVKGRAAHAGMAPQDGRNAATGLVHQLDRIAGLVPLSGDGPTLNLTMLNAGERSNIIPDNAEAQFSLRIRKPEERDQILAKLSAAMEPTLDTQVSVTADPGYPPLIETPDVDALADRAQAIYAELGKTIARSGNGGASESAVAQAVGTPALDGLGLVGGDFHTDHEWIDLGSLTPRLYLITRLLMETGANPPHKANP